MYVCMYVCMCVRMYMDECVQDLLQAPFLYRSEWFPVTFFCFSGSDGNGRGDFPKRHRRPPSAPPRPPLVPRPPLPLYRRPIIPPTPPSTLQQKE